LAAFDIFSRTMISSRTAVVLVLSAAAVVPRIAGAAGDGSVPIGPASRARFAASKVAAAALTRRDGFVSAMSPFDRSARLEVGREVPEREYLAFVAKEVREWTDSEREMLSRILGEFRERTARWNLDMPSEVLFLKTTGREEGRAAYCRGAAVVLPERDLADAGKLHDIVFHELFHVYSSHHPELRRDLYRVVGYEVCPEISLPPALARRKLTNPDAPRMDAFIRLPLGGETVAVAPIILGRSDLYDEKVGGPFFRQMDFRLMVLEGAEGAPPRPALQPDGAPRFVPPGDEYMARIGRNTEYIIHPEEILADNFVLLVNGAKVQSPEILEKLDAALRAARR
jgi:hypothetical protein